jgi:hypothetical protein
MMTLRGMNDKRDISPLKPKLYSGSVKKIPAPSFLQIFACYKCSNDIAYVFYNKEEGVSLCEIHAYLGEYILEMGKEKYELSQYK